MEINLELGIDSKIDAINYILAAIGSVGINSEEEIEWNIDAAEADKLIDNVAQKVQTNLGKGYWFNKESFHKFTPDSVTGQVVIPSNSLSCFVKRSDSELFKITTRANKLFDVTELGYDMSTLVQSDYKVHCTIVVNLAYEDLPATAKHAIVDACRFWFVNDKEGDTIKMQSLKTTADGSMAALTAEQAGQKRRNMFQNGYIKNNLSRIGGINNN